MPDWPSGGSRPVVGFIGLGRMGGPMAANVRRAGFDLVAHDLRSSSLAPLVDLGARVASSPRAVASACDLLITMLPGPPQVEAAVLGADGAFGALRPGSVWVDMSTSTPAWGGRAAELGAERGVAVLDAPVAGMVKGAESGTLQIFVGGDAVVVARCRPVLEAMGDPKRILHVGAKGAGYAVKLCLNLLWFIHAAAAGEVMVLGVQAGVDPAVLRQALTSGPASSTLLERDIDPVFRGDYDESFTLDLVTKDLGLAIDLGREVGVPLELSGLVEQLHRRARAVYGDRAGELSAIRLVEDAAGVQLRLPSPIGVSS